MNKLLGVTVLASFLHMSFFLHVQAFSKFEFPFSSGTKFNSVSQIESLDVSKVDQNQLNDALIDTHSKILGIKKPVTIIHFSYAHPEEWSHESPECAGKHQSPVNLDPDKFIDFKSSSSLIWIGYDNQPQKLKIADNGHTVEVSGTWDKKSVPFIRGGPLRGDYIFAQLHFHWGSENSIGSEHTIGNNSFPMEMHIVHYKRDYETFENALKHDDGLAVVGIFLKVIDERSNSGVNVLKNGLRKIQNKPKQQIPIKPFSLTSLNFMFLKNYASYSGSLTTPPCREIVTWIVSLSPLTISRETMESFRKISNKWSEKENYRPLQAINDRSIYYVGR